MCIQLEMVNRRGQPPRILLRARGWDAADAVAREFPCSFPVNDRAAAAAGLELLSRRQPIVLEFPRSRARDARRNPQTRRLTRSWRKRVVLSSGRTHAHNSDALDVDMSESNEDQTFSAVYDDPTQWLPKEVLEANDESSTIAFTRFGERVPASADMNAPGQGGGAFTDFMGDSGAKENSYNPFGFSPALVEQTAQPNVRARLSKLQRWTLVFLYCLFI